MLITKWRRWQDRGRKEGGRDRKGEKREPACVRETDVTAKNNQYNLRWWKQHSVWVSPSPVNSSGLLTLYVKSPLLLCSNESAFPWCFSFFCANFLFELLNAFLPGQVAAVFPRGKSSKVSPKNAYQPFDFVPK